MSKEGHRSAVARSGQETLQVLGTESFDLAFVDVKLPDMEGLELVSKIRAQRPELVCILVSGYFFDDDVPVQKGLASGLISGFIGKPFILSQVRQALQNLKL